MHTQALGFPFNVIPRQRDKLERLNMGKTLNKSDIISIAKSIISAGADAQPGVTSAMLVREIQKRADAAYASQPLSAAQRFSRYTANPDSDGAVLLKASRRAVPEAMGSWDADEAEIEDAEKECGDEAYSKLSTMARQLMAERERAGTPISFPGAFQEAYAKRPDLAQVSKAHHIAKIAKAGGYGRR
jgi:hypothetical protein